MKTVWIGQAGLLIETNNRKILIDPYLSNSVGKINPNKSRRTPVDNSLFDIYPDFIILTHNHLDHTDPDTLKIFLEKYSKITVLASKNSWNTVRSFSGNNNCVMFNRHTVWSENGIEFTAVKAEHSDDYAIGTIIDNGKQKYYITGDTLYNNEIFSDIPNNIDALFLPINGVGNNMNFFDAEKFANKIKPKKVIPLHFGLFDDINPNDFKCQNKVIPHIYKQIGI